MKLAQILEARYEGPSKTPRQTTDMIRKAIIQTFPDWKGKIKLKRYTDRQHVPHVRVTYKREKVNQNPYKMEPVIIMKDEHVVRKLASVLEKIFRTKANYWPPSYDGVDGGESIEMAMVD